jgi:GTP pyrophosphokinase
MENGLDINLTICIKRENDMNKQLIFLKGFAKGREYWEMLKAIQVATELHDGQVRKSGGQYIEHPIYVAHTLVSLKLYDEALLTAAILHDVVEDCNISTNDLVMKYGFSSEVASIVSLLSKQPGESTDVYYTAISYNVKSALIKIADRSHNISTMIGAFSEDKMKSYVKETEEFVMPLCRYAIRQYPEYSDDIYIMRNHIESVLNCIKNFLKIGNDHEI